jgi:hypothetical protein
LRSVALSDVRMAYGAILWPAPLVLNTGSKARMHLYLSTRIPMAHVFSMTNFRLGSHGLRVDRGRWEGWQHISYGDRTCKRCIKSSLVDDEYRARFVCPGTACIRQDFSEVVQQCSLGSPELLLMALVAYPDVKLVEPFSVSLFKGGSTTSITCIGMTT